MSYLPSTLLTYGGCLFYDYIRFWKVAQVQVFIKNLYVYALAMVFISAVGAWQEDPKLDYRLAMLHEAL